MSDSFVVEKKKTAIITDLVEFQKRLNANLDAADKSNELTSMLGFVSAGKHWLINLGDLREVEAVPPKNLLPQIQLAKPWVLGVANFKGYIYTMIDLQLFLGGDITTLSMNSRSLLLGHRFLVQPALVVPEIIGLVGTVTLSEMPMDSVSDRSKWTKRIFKTPDGVVWEELDLLMLTESRDMLDVEA